MVEVLQEDEELETNKITKPEQASSNKISITDFNSDTKKRQDRRERIANSKKRIRVSRERPTNPSYNRNRK